MQAIANSPVHLPELFGLLQSQSSPAGDDAVHVRGTAALVVAVCLLELPVAKHGASADRGLDPARLMKLLAERIGVDGFTRAAEDLQQSLVALEGVAPQGAISSWVSCVGRRARPHEHSCASLGQS